MNWVSCCLQTTWFQSNLSQFALVYRLSMLRYSLYNKRERKMKGRGEKEERLKKEIVEYLNRIWRKIVQKRHERVPFFDTIDWLTTELTNEM